MVYGRSRVLLLVVAVLLSLGVGTAMAISLHSAEIHAAEGAGSSHLASLQNPDGGWFFVVGDIDCGFGPGVSCPNTFGVTARGLVAAYREGGYPAAITAAKLAADTLIATHGTAPPCDDNPATGGDRPFTVDVTYLMTDIAKSGGVTTHDKRVYQAAAVAWFSCVQQDFPFPSNRANNRIDGRIAQGLDNLGAWDASLDIQAALGVGADGYAVGEALQVIARAADWDVADPDCPGCELISKALFVKATEKLSGVPDIQTARLAYVNDLLASQNPDGSWLGDTQIAAYAVMALVSEKLPTGTLIGRPKDAAGPAVAFLLSMQQPDGGFFVGVGFPYEVTEVDGEVLLALYLYKIKQ